MIFDTPWEPMLNGVVCVRYEPYQTEVDDKTTPRHSREPTWSNVGLSEELTKTPLGADALCQRAIFTPSNFDF